MHDMLSSDADVLQALSAVDGRYIQWQWDPRTLADDYITLREATGSPVVGHDKSGREFWLRGTCHAFLPGHVHFSRKGKKDNEK